MTTYLQDVICWTNIRDRVNSKSKRPMRACPIWLLLVWAGPYGQLMHRRMTTRHKITYKTWMTWKPEAKIAQEYTNIAGLVYFVVLYSVKGDLRMPHLWNLHFVNLYYVKYIKYGLGATQIATSMSNKSMDIIFAGKKKPAGRSTMSPRACHCDNPKIVSMSESCQNYPTMKFRLRNLLFGGLRSKTCATKSNWWNIPNPL
jgi:hypothetical protein